MAQSLYQLPSSSTTSNVTGFGGSGPYGPFNPQYPQLQEKINMVTILNEKHKNMKAIRDATTRVFGRQFVSSSAKWKNGEITPQSFLGQMVKSMTLDQLYELNMETQLTSATQYTTQRLQTFVEQQQPTPPNLGQKVQTNPVYVQPPQTPIPAPLQIPQIPTTKTMNTRQEAKKYLSGGVQSRLAKEGGYVPNMTSPGMYQYQIPSALKSSQATTGYTNMVRMYAWANEINRLNDTLQKSQENVEVLTRDFTKCLSQNVPDVSTRNKIRNCMLNLLSGIEGREKVAAMLLEGISQIQSSKPSNTCSLTFFD